MTPPPPLSLLYGRNCYQLFIDDQEAEGLYPEILHGEWAELYDTLVQRNNAGLGVFYTCNQTDGAGRRAENITAVRAWYVDIDGLRDDRAKRGMVRRLLEHPCPPSSIVETRNGLHVSWLAVPGVPVEKERYRATEEGLISVWGGDPSAKDLSRVLRVPGFYHMKKRPGEPKPEPFEITVVHEDDLAFYREEDLREHFPPPERNYRPTHDRAQITYSSDDWGVVAGAIADWRPVPNSRHRVMTLACGVALKFGISEGRCVDDLLPIVTGWDTGRQMDAELRRTARWAYEQAQPATVTALRNEGVDVPKLSRPPE